jgi:hypothetical protein
MRRLAAVDDDVERTPDVEASSALRHCDDRRRFRSAAERAHAAHHLSSARASSVGEHLHAFDHRPERVSVLLPEARAGQ